MSWTRAYHLVLHLLPATLREKHGPAMEALFERELVRARADGWVRGMLTGAAGVADVLRRAAYELVRPGRVIDADPVDARSVLTTSQLIARLARSFAIVFVTLTATLLLLFARKQLPELTAHGAPPGTLARVVLLAVPFTAALTIPMAVLVPVLHVFTRLGADGTLAAARRAPHGLRRLVGPVLVASALVAGLALVEIAEVVPRANARLVTAMTGRADRSSARAMTLGELRAAERTARTKDTPLERGSAATYEVEIQKKFALPAACLVLALAGIAIALSFPRGGLGLVLGASVAVFTVYYLIVTTGESLAHRMVVSPFVGMWGANVILLLLALLAIGWHRSASASRADRHMVIGG